MPLVTAAVVPHSPLLIPSIAKDHARLSDRTRSAFHEIAELIHASAATTLIFLTPHAVSIRNQVVLLSGESLTGDLKTFGDLTTTVVPVGVQVLHELREHLTNDGLSVMLQSQAPLDYGVVVPIRLFDFPKPLPVVAVSVGHVSADVLIRLGRNLVETANRSTERIAVIASADLSRRRKQDERADRPTTLERHIARGISSGKVSDLPTLSSHAICGLAPITTLIAGLEGRHTEAKVLTSEAPYGVGYLTAVINV